VTYFIISLGNGERETSRPLTGSDFWPIRQWQFRWPSAYCLFKWDFFYTCISWWDFNWYWNAMSQNHCKSFIPSKVKAG